MNWPVNFEGYNFDKNFIEKLQNLERGSWQPYTIIGQFFCLQKIML